MPTYALLGATGGTGSAILRHLLSSPPPRLTLSIFVRNKSKLLTSFPQLDTTSPFSVKITEGGITDELVLQSCLKDADIIFMCIATNDASPSVSIHHDSASATVEALAALRQQDDFKYKTPTVLQLRSASCNSNVGGFGTSMAHFALYHIYADLGRACELYEARASEGASDGAGGLFDYVYVDPPSIHDADGTECTGYRLIPPAMQKSDGGGPSLSYSDLGAAFVEVAERRGEFVGDSVIVSATGKVKETWGVLVPFLLRGVKGRVLGW